MVGRCCRYRSRFMINATHPANRPPPNSVVPKYTNMFVSLVRWVPSHKSRNPPWTIKTERVSNAPIMNHHRNERRAIVALAVISQLVGNSIEGSPRCQAKGWLRIPHRSRSLVPPCLHARCCSDEDRYEGFSPRWRKIETLPLPLSAMANPGSSVPMVVARNDVTAKGPACVR